MIPSIPTDRSGKTDQTQIKEQYDQSTLFAILSASFGGITTLSVQSLE